MKKAAKIIIAAIIAYIIIFITDFTLILNEKNPVFCIIKETDLCHESDYTCDPRPVTGKLCHGLGYTYEIIPNLITGKREYALFIFGQPISSNIINSTPVIEQPAAVDEAHEVTETKTASDTSAVSEGLSETVTSTAVQTNYEPSTERSNIVIVSSYRNWAWGYQHSGTFIDFEGKVYEFDFSDEEIKNNDDFLTRLEEYYHSADLSYSQKVSDPTLISEIAALSDKISSNAEITKEHTAYDAGQNTIYLLNSENKLVKIYSNGDYTEINTDENAVRAADLCRKL